jgi:hypothetical protein
LIGGSLSTRALTREAANQKIAGVTARESSAKKYVTVLMTARAATLGAAARAQAIWFVRETMMIVNASS